MKYIDVLKGYSKKLTSETGMQVVLVPKEVSSEKFHVSLSLLPHPVMIGNGRTRFRLRATAAAEVPASDPAIEDCLKKSIRLAVFFDDDQGFDIKEGKHGMAYHKKIREEDELFTDLMAEERSFSYRESWLVELEFTLDQIKEN